MRTYSLVIFLDILIYISSNSEKTGHFHLNIFIQETMLKRCLCNLRRVDFLLLFPSAVDASPSCLQKVTFWNAFWLCSSLSPRPTFLRWFSPLFSFTVCLGYSLLPKQFFFFSVAFHCGRNLTFIELKQHIFLF